MSQSDGRGSAADPAATARQKSIRGRWWRTKDRAGDLVASLPFVDREGPTAFVLAGGGSSGAVQVGMLAELVDRGIRADRVYGVSVGAVNGAAYCGDPTPTGVARLEQIWRNLSGGDVFPRPRVHGPWSWFQQRPAVHADTGLRRVIASGLRFENLEDATIPLEVVATSLSDGRERWLTSGPALEAILASTAIPALLPPVTIGDEVLVDGGIVDNVPLSRAIAGGARRIYVLLCGPLRYQPPIPKRPVEAVLTAFFVAVHARFARELEAVPRGVEVVVFSGGGEPSAAYRDFTASPELIEEGRAQAAAVLGPVPHDRARGPHADGASGWSRAATLRSAEGARDPNQV